LRSTLLASLSYSARRPTSPLGVFIGLLHRFPAAAQ
jgi:hypothetical protein